MTSPPPHLLTLPRELRDNIYEDLGQEVTLRWAWDDTTRIREFNFTSATAFLGNKVADVTIHNYPLGSVLLTHTQLHDEYLDYCSKNPIVTIVVHSTRWALGFSKEQLVKLEEDQKLIEAALTHVRHGLVIIRLDHPSPCRGHGEPAPIDEMMLNRFLDACSSKMSHLQSLRIAIQRDHNKLIPQRDLPQWIRPAGRRKDFLPRLPDTLAGLTKRQRGKGYLVRSGTIPSASESVYDTFRLGVYTYCRDTGKKTESRFCTTEMILGRLPHHVDFDLYLNASLGTVLEQQERDSVVGHSPFALAEWEEKRGREEIQAPG